MLKQCMSVPFVSFYASIPFDSLCITPFSLFPQRLGKRTALCREIAREVAGLCPYERRILDMIKTGGSAADKRIYKFAKRRLGTHKRAVHKREDIKTVNAAQRAKAAGV
jgi:large subunit ribosomal protein L36e